MTSDSSLKRLSVPVSSLERPIWVPYDFGKEAARILEQPPDDYDVLDNTWVFILFHREFIAQTNKLRQNNIPYETK